MANKTLTRLRDQFRAEAEQLRQRLAKLEKALEGMEAAIELAGDDIEPSTPSEDENVMGLIVDEATNYEGEIRAPEFATHLEDKYGRYFNRSTVSHALRKAAEEGKLKLLEKGQGKRSSVYVSQQARLALVTK